MYVAERLDKQGKLFRTFVIENFVIKPSCGIYGIFDYVLYKIISYIKQNSCSVLFDLYINMISSKTFLEY